MRLAVNTIVAFGLLLVAGCAPAPTPVGGVFGTPIADDPVMRRSPAPRRPPAGGELREIGKQLDDIDVQTRALLERIGREP